MHLLTAKNACRLITALLLISSIERSLAQNDTAAAAAGGGGCQCPPQMKGMICGGILSEYVPGNQCKFRQIFSCFGAPALSAATGGQECGARSCITKQDIKTSILVSACTPFMPYIIDHESWLHKIAAYSRQHSIDGYLEGG